MIECNFYFTKDHWNTKYLHSAPQIGSFVSYWSSRGIIKYLVKEVEYVIKEEYIGCNITLERISI